MAKRGNLKTRFLEAWNDLPNRAVFQQNGIIVNGFGECGVSDNEDGKYRKISKEEAAAIYSLDEKEIPGRISSTARRFGWYLNDFSGYRTNRKRRRLIRRISSMPYIKWINMPIPVSNLLSQADDSLTSVLADDKVNSFGGHNLWTKFRNRLQMLKRMILQLLHKVLSLISR